MYPLILPAGLVDTFDIVFGRLTTFLICNRVHPTYIRNASKGWICDLLHVSSVSHTSLAFSGGLSKKMYQLTLPSPTVIPESPQPLSRPCPFCDRSVPDLRRHFITTHKHNDRVKAVVDDESSDRISKQQRMYAFDQLKKKGIQQRNRCILGGNGDDLHCERRSEGMKVMCSSCKGFYKKGYFYRH